MNFYALRLTAAILCLICTAFLSLDGLSAQDIDSTALVKKIDFRGKRPQSAIVASLSASREKVVVLLVRGGCEKLIAGAEGQMKALIHNGYDRIGMIVSDNPPDEIKPAISVFSNGQVYAVIEDANSDAYTGWAIYNLVKDAYREDILPQTGKTFFNDQDKTDQ